MYKSIILLFVIFLIYSCGCEDRGIITNEIVLTDFESSIILSDLNEQNEFTNQLSEIYSAQYSEKNIEPIIIPLNRDDCSVNNLESNKKISDQLLT